MPDVGILNLQIHDNSSTAAEGLGRLATKLEAVKQATSGIKLGSVATGLKRLNDELKNIQPSAIFKLKQLADVLERIGNISGNVGGIRISFGGGASGQSAESIAESMRQARETAAQAASGFEEIGSRIQQDAKRANDFYNSINRVNELVQQTGWSAQSTAEQFSGMFKAWSDFRMSNSLNAGQNPLGLGDGTGGSGAQWTLWKEGAIEVEGTVSEAMDAVQLGAGEAVLRLTGVVEQTANVASGFESVQSTVQSTNNEFNSAARAAEAMAQRINLSRQMFADSSDKVKEYVASLLGMSKEQLFPPNMAAQVNEFGSAMQGAAGDARTLQNDLRRDYGQQMVEDLVNASSKADLLKMRIDSLKHSLATKINNNTVDGNQIAQATARIQALQAEYDELIRKTKETGGATRSLKERLSELAHGSEGLSGAFKRMFPTISGLLGRFKQIVKYRMLRAVIQHISKGFTEGVQNVYQYSKAIGSSLAPAMDSASSMFLQFKNSIGAAVAPLIQALIPVLNQIVSAVITAINYLNQFFALLGGQATWTRALPQTTKAFDKQKKAAGGAGAAIKDLLADWDELNIIQSQNSGGGGGGGTGAAEDYLNMFKEETKFESKIKDIVNFIKENFDTILTVAEGIGAAILAWKISKAFDKTLGMLQFLELAAGVTLLITGVKTAAAAGYDVGLNGLNSDNLLKSIGGIFETALGGGLIGVAFGGIQGGLIGLTVGTMVGLVVLGANIMEGSFDALYGDVQLTAEEIQQEVDNLFTIDVNAELAKAKVDHESIEQAKKDVSAAIREAEADFITFKMKLTPESASELLASVNQTVDATNALLKLFQKKISIGFGFESSFDDPEFVQQFSTEKITGLNEYVTGLGNDIGKILEDGIVDGMDEQKMLDELMTKISNITRAIAEGRASGEFVAGLERGNYGRDWTKANRASLKEYANTYTEQLKNAQEAGYTQALDTKGSLGAVYRGMLQRETDNPGTYTKQELEQARKDYEEFDMQGAIDDYVEKVSAEGREIFVKNMVAAFGSAIDKANMDTTLFTSELSTGGSLGDYINKNMASNLGWDIKEFEEVLGAMGMSGWQMLSDELKRGYVKNIINALGDNKDTYGRLKNELNIPVDEILEIKKSSWDKWSDKSRQSFLASMAQIYGGREVLEAMHGLGFNLGEIIDASSGFNEETKQSLYKSLAEIFNPDVLNEMLRNRGIEPITIADFVSVDEEASVPGIEGVPEEGVEIPAHFQVEEWDPSSMFGDAVPEVDFAVDVDSSMSEPVSMPPIDSSAFTQTLDAMTKYTADSVATIQRYLDALNTLTSAASFFGIPIPSFPNIEQRASGGPVRSGDLVMANENGNFEMMGRMGNQPVVANNQQIVQGISNGVAQANGDVVGELRTLTGLMQRMLQKEFVAKAVPGSGWARMNDTSNAAYSNISGNA